MHISRQTCPAVICCKARERKKAASHHASRTMNERLRPPKLTQIWLQESWFVCSKAKETSPFLSVCEVWQEAKTSLSSSPKAPAQSNSIYFDEFCFWRENLPSLILTAKLNLALWVSETVIQLPWERENDLEQLFQQDPSWRCFCSWNHNLHVSQPTQSGTPWRLHPLLPALSRLQHHPGSFWQFSLCLKCTQNTCMERRGKTSV